MPGGQQWALLVELLRELSGAEGRATLNPEARRTSESWRRQVEREAGQHRAVEIVSAFDTRLSVTAIKYALLLELATT